MPRFVSSFAKRQGEGKLGRKKAQQQHKNAMAKKSEVEQRKLAIDLYECERWSVYGRVLDKAPEHVKEAWGSVARAREQVNTSRRLVETFSRRKQEMFLYSVRKPLPDNEKLIILRRDNRNLACIPLAPADAAEMVTWETAQHLLEMKERLDRESLELISLYEQIWQLDNVRKFREQWELVQEVSATLHQVAGNVQEYRRVQNRFNQEITDWREAHAKIMRPWGLFVERFPAAKSDKETMEVPQAAKYFDWCVRNKEFTSRAAENAWVVEHIASTEVAGEAWRSEHEDDPQKMAVYEERLAHQAFAKKLWAAIRNTRGD